MGSPSEEKQYILRGKNVFNVLTILQQKSSISRTEITSSNQFSKLRKAVFRRPGA